jgi:hypothetical protein
MKIKIENLILLKIGKWLVAAMDGYEKRQKEKKRKKK